MQNITIGMLTINSRGDGQKKDLISEVAAQKKIDVLFLQETHTNAAVEIDWALWWQGPHLLSHGTSVSAGVSILFRTSLNAAILAVTGLTLSGQSKDREQRVLFC